MYLRQSRVFFAVEPQLGQLEIGLCPQTLKDGDACLVKPALFALLGREDRTLLLMCSSIFRVSEQKSLRNDMSGDTETMSSRLLMDFSL